MMKRKHFKSFGDFNEACDGRLPVPVLNPESYQLRRALEGSVMMFGAKNKHLYKTKEDPKIKYKPKAFVMPERHNPKPELIEPDDEELT